MNRHTILSLGTTLVGLICLTRGDIYPDIADISHASQPAADFFQGYFTAKSFHNATRWQQFFDPTQAVYYDAVLGDALTSFSEIVSEFTEITQEWPKNATSFPLQILGDMSSAVVRYVDTPGLFGAEIRTISAFDFRSDKVTRQVDYWDGRRNPVIAERVPYDQYPSDLGLSSLNGLDEGAAPEMNRTAQRLNAALSTGDAEAAAAQFSYDAIFEDLTLRTREDGQLAIGRYLQRALAQLPYGPGASVRHVLGSAKGGGYEWKTDGQTVPNGITALELDGCGLITRLTTVWDGSRMSDSAIQAQAALSIEP